MDKEELEWRITSFFDWWRRRHAFISDLDLTKQRYEANVLLWGSLDALSNLWSKKIGKENCNSDRKRIIFDAFLVRYGGDVFQLVSLPDVWSRVEKKEIKLPENVSIFLSTIGGRKIYSTIHTYEDDLGMDAHAIRYTSDDLSMVDIINQTLASCPEATRCELEQWLTLSRYGAIAYKEFRSAYIHEGRPGKRTHDYRLNEYTERPTYQSWVYSTPPIMGFSVEFMLSVFNRCIEEFKAEALALQVDPVPPSDS